MGAEQTQYASTTRGGVCACVCVTLPRLAHRHQPLSQIHELTFRNWVSSSHPLCSFLNEKVASQEDGGLLIHLKFSSSLAPW